MAESYLPEDFEVVFPTPTSQEFWARCNRHELAFQRCTACGTFRHPPGPLCYHCQSADVTWVAVSGDATLYSFTIVTHAVHPSLGEKIPFNVALVEFPDAPGVRLITNVVDAEPEELKVGMAVQVHWGQPVNGQILPRFAKA